jgi:predicted acylesterase/phospholipase RssA
LGVIEFLLGAIVGVLMAVGYYEGFGLRISRLDDAWQDGFEAGRDWQTDQWWSPS